MKNGSIFFGNKPHQITLKDNDQRKLLKVVIDKEKYGWECVVPIQKTNTYNGLVTYKTVMRYVG
jgi:hypothetical protein